MFTMLTKKQLEMVLKFCALDKDECLAVDNLDARQGAREWIMWSEYDCFLNCIGCIFRPFSLRMHFQAFPQSVTGYKFGKMHKINIARIAKAALHKLPGKSSLNVNFVYPVCPVCPVWNFSKNSSDLVAGRFPNLQLHFSYRFHTYQLRVMF